MGILEHFRPPPEVEWRPPAQGVCRCESHIEDLLEMSIPYADGAGVAAVSDLVRSGALTTVPTPDRLFVPGVALNERRGPYHWRVLPQRQLDPFSAPGAASSLDDALFVQPHVERVLWLGDRSELAVGASALCMRGVQAAVVRALSNPRIRVADG